MLKVGCKCRHGSAGDTAAVRTSILDAAVSTNKVPKTTPNCFTCVDARHFFAETSERVGASSVTSQSAQKNATHTYQDSDTSHRRLKAQHRHEVLQHIDGTLH